MTPIWFGSLATTMHLLAKKIKITHMAWINRSAVQFSLLWYQTMY